MSRRHSSTSGRYEVPEEAGALVVRVRHQSRNCRWEAVTLEVVRAKRLTDGLL